ncbi:hypothetical protein ACFE04_006306 [Oxalis oulophora]
MNSSSSSSSLCFNTNQPFFFLSIKYPLHNFSSYSYKPIKLTLTLTLKPKACIDNDIDMVPNKQGIYTPKQSNKVVILWDLDNKPPRGPPYEAAMSLKQVASKFGNIIDISAYANRHAFVHLPHWVVEERRDRKHLDLLERKGVITPSSELYVCGVCGRKCKTNLDLKKHFKNLHEREREKKVSRMRQLKGKKRQKYKERFIVGNSKYTEAARKLIQPKVGYGLANELRRAGVFVKTVEDKPQAADWAVKKQMQHSMSRGIDWLVLVSDDGDFKDMLRKAREASLGTVVVGDMDRALGREADVWVPWMAVENGRVTDRDLVPKSSRGNADIGATGVKERGFDMDAVLNDIIAGRGEFGDGAGRVSAFSEEDDEGLWVSHGDEDYLLDEDSDSDSDNEDDAYF